MFPLLTPPGTWTAVIQLHNQQADGSQRTSSQNCLKLSPRHFPSDGIQRQESIFFALCYYRSEYTSDPGGHPRKCSLELKLGLWQERGEGNHPYRFAHWFLRASSWNPHPQGQRVMQPRNRKSEARVLICNVWVTQPWASQLHRDCFSSGEKRTGRGRFVVEAMPSYGGPWVC